MAFLTTERAGYVVTVTLDRPPVNALTNEVFLEIRDTFTEISADRDVRAVIFTAAGDRAFMGGADLEKVDDLDDGGDDPVYVVDPGRKARDAMWAITDCSAPVIGAINGPAVGAGVAFAVCCDILVAAESASFGTLEINVGLLGASAHLSAIVGRHKAREMFFLGEKVPATDLHRLGVVRSVVPRAELLRSAHAIADELSAKSPIALRLAKESMNRVEGLPLKDAYRIEQDYTRRLLGFDDAAEARQAFLEKRAPDWKWR